MTEIANIRLRIVSRGVGVTNPDGSGTTRASARWIVLLLLCVGVIEMFYGIWAARSATAAAPVFHASASCRMPTMDSLDTSPGRVCRSELAVVVGKHIRTNRSSRTYYLETVLPDGRRDQVALASWRSTALWRRVQATQHVVVQRFVAPGYYLTGKVVAYADSEGTAVTRYHPDSGTHYESGYAVMGAMITIGMLITYLRSFRVGRR